MRIDQNCFFCALIISAKLIFCTNELMAFCFGRFCFYSRSSWNNTSGVILPEVLKRPSLRVHHAGHQLRRQLWLCKVCFYFQVHCIAPLFSQCFRIVAFTAMIKSPSPIGNKETALKGILSILVFTLKDFCSQVFSLPAILQECECRSNRFSPRLPNLSKVDLKEIIKTKLAKSEKEKKPPELWWLLMAMF